jgi:hypothetical protein
LPNLLVFSLGETYGKHRRSPVPFVANVQGQL